ncbi:unnamed protein product [Camellia sinensis]
MRKGAERDMIERDENETSFFFSFISVREVFKCEMKIVNSVSRDMVQHHMARDSWTGTVCINYNYNKREWMYT